MVLPHSLRPLSMHVAGLAIYPVKGLRGLTLDQAAVERCGLGGDRRWAIAALGGKVLTQRDVPAMARIDAWYDGDTLRLEATGHGAVEARPDAMPARVNVWGTIVPMVAASDAASAWLTRVLGTACSLAYMADAAARPVTPDLARPGDVVSLADGFPLLLTNAASVTDLNLRLAEPVPMDRFRPNLVVDGAPAWAEDDWARVTAGAVRLRLASRCSRCKVITLDQRTGEVPSRMQPLRTLGSFHRDHSGAITFGCNAIPETLGTIRVGDEVQVVPRTLQQ